MQRLNLDKELMGLRRSWNNPVNAGGCVVLRNAKPTENGLEPIVPVVSPFTAEQLSAAGVTVSYPFPQLFIGKAVRLLADERAIYEIDENWNLTRLSTYRADNWNLEKAIVNSGAYTWHFLDGHTSWALVNHDCAVIRGQWHANAQNGVTVPDRVFVYDADTVNTGCVHGGRFVWGGIAEDRMNTVAWSMTGGGDAFSRFVPGAYSADLQSFNARRADAGEIVMPFSGKVRRILPLGDGLAVYGEKGIAFLNWRAVDPVATYGVSSWFKIGVPVRGAAAGDERGHVFVSDFGELWRVGPDFQFTKLGYREFIEPLLDDGPLTISHDAARGEFHIASSDEAFLLTDQGLAETNQRVTSVYDNGVVYGMAEDRGDPSFRLTTDRFDFGTRLSKVVHTVSAIGGLSASVQCRADTSAYRTNGPVVLDGSGKGVIRTAGVDFRVSLTGEDASVVNLDSLTIEYDMVGRMKGNAKIGLE
jgi:hypothetical protein